MKERDVVTVVWSSYRCQGLRLTSRQTEVAAAAVVEEVERPARAGAPSETCGTRGGGGGEHSLSRAHGRKDEEAPGTAI